LPKGADHGEHGVQAYNEGPGAEPPVESRGRVPGGAKGGGLPPEAESFLSIFIQKRDQKLKI